MRRAFATAVALLLPIALAGGPAAASPQGTPPAQTANATSPVAPKFEHPGTLVAQGPDDICDFTKRRPNLQRGSSGSAVRQAQCYLNAAIDAGLDEDGDFGRVTRSAVRDFQRCAEIVVDGRIGSQTWSFLSFWANDLDAPFC